MLIDDSTPNDVLFDPAYSRGGLPRDYSVSPIEMFAPPSSIPIIPRSEWDARIDEQERTESSLEHIWKRSGQSPLDQDGKGYCWAHSTTVGVMATRARMNQPNARLSAFAVACEVKNYRDEGGWAALSAEFIRDRGVPSVEFWPEQSMDKKNDKPATWIDAAKHKITMDFVDLTRPVWGENLSFDQLATCLLMNYACPVDLYFWGHSVCALRLVRVEAGSYGVRILNSWYTVPKVKPWGDNGFATLRGTKAVPDGALAIVAATAS